MSPLAQSLLSWWAGRRKSRSERLSSNASSSFNSVARLVITRAAGRKPLPDDFGLGIDGPAVRVTVLAFAAVEPLVVGRARGISPSRRRHEAGLLDFTVDGLWRRW